MPSLWLGVDSQHLFRLLYHLLEHLARQPITRVQSFGDNLLGVRYQHTGELPTIDASLTREIALFRTFCILGCGAPRQVHNHIVTVFSSCCACCKRAWL